VQTAAAVFMIDDARAARHLLAEKGTVLRDARRVRPSSSTPRL
jgi:hypothetical protein